MVADAAAKQAVASGATVIQDKTLGPGGTSVTVADAGGVVVALFTPAAAGGPGPPAAAQPRRRRLAAGGPGSAHDQPPTPAEGENETDDR
jgi:hypothetical protein